MPPQEHNVRVIGLDLLNNNLGIIIDLARNYLQPPIVESEDRTLETFNWLIDHDVHVMVGKGDKGPYVRVLPVSGIPQRTLNGPIDRSLARLRRETETLLGGRRPTRLPSWALWASR